MPLNHGYGVVIGTRHHYHRDPVNDYGQYFHGNLYVSAPAGTYHCAIDVDSKFLPNGVQWKTVELPASALKGIDALSNGWHLLAASPASGALDYIRNPDLRPLKPGCLLGATGIWARLLGPLMHDQPWKSGRSTDALAELEPLIDASQRLFVFGEPFHDGTLGVHNIHQNQGDPPGTEWSAENGIWQDGATLAQRTDGSYAVFCNKFKTQASVTDSTGRPA
jgi:hypothetical protein